MVHCVGWRGQDAGGLGYRGMISPLLLRALILGSLLESLRRKGNYSEVWNMLNRFLFQFHMESF